MQLEHVRKDITRDLSSPTAVAAFAQGRERNQALASFEAPGDVVRFLNERELSGCRQRSDVTAAVLAEARGRSEGCWAAVLMAAYFPGLLRIRSSVRPTASVDPDELNGLILESFMEVVATLPLDTQGRRAVVNLVLGTRKLVWRTLARDLQRCRRECPLNDWEEALHCSTAPSPEQIIMGLEAEDLLSPGKLEALLEELAGPWGDEDDVLLLLGTYASDTPLIEWVKARRPELGKAELLREYGRLRRRRSRLIERIRQRLQSTEMAEQRERLGLLLHGATGGHQELGR